VPRDLQHFVEESLAVLEREAPTFFVSLCESVKDLHLSISSEGRPFALHFAANSIVTAAPSGADDVYLTTDRQAILALVDGELTVEDALRHDRLEVRGRPLAVACFFSGLLVYVRGGIRCPSFPRLISDFRLS